MQTLKQLLLIIISFFFYLSSSGQSSAWDRYQRRIQQEGEQKTIEGNRKIQDLKRESDRIERENRITNNSGSNIPKPQKTANEIELDKISSNARNYPISNNSVAGQAIYFLARDMGAIYGRFLGRTKDKWGQEVNVVWASPYQFNELKNKVHENLEYVYFIQWVGYWNEGNLYKKYGIEVFRNKYDYQILDLVNKDIQAEMKIMDADKEKRLFIENSVPNLRSAPWHSIASFIYENGKIIEERYVKVENFTRGYRLRIWSSLDSIFILNDGRNESNKTWTVYLVDLTKQPNLPVGKLFTSYPESVLKPGAGSVQWSIEKYFKEIEKRLNKKLGKRSVDEMLAYYDKLDKEKKAKEEAAAKKIEQEKLAKFKQLKANRKPGGSLLRNSPFHSVVPYYISDEKNFRFDLNEGYKLAIPAKDSIFVLSDFKEIMKIHLVDQEKNKASDEGTIFPYNYSYLQVRSLLPGSNSSQDKLIYQEDIIKMIEREVYGSLKKNIPADSSIPKYMTIGPTISVDTKYDLNRIFFKMFDESIPPGKNLKLEKDNSYRGVDNGYGIFIDQNNTKQLGWFSNSGINIKNHELQVVSPSVLIKQNGEMFFSTNTYSRDSSFTSFLDPSFLMTKEGKVFIVEKKSYTNPGLSTEPMAKNIRKTDFGIVTSVDFEKRNALGAINGCLIQYKNADIYYGSINDDLQKINRGILIKANGDIYIGNFEKDKTMGIPGIYFFSNGNIYQGVFVNEQMEMYGEFYDNLTQERYIGPFKNGKKHGFGKIVTFGKDEYGHEKKIIKNVTYDDGVLRQ